MLTYFIETRKGNEMNYIDCKNYVQGFKEYLQLCKDNYFDEINFCQSNGKVMHSHRKEVR